ncbi:MAG: hypothetical protein LQ341_006351 [Variospora aurantia]|nr:MAG: hypothetical protein LQ341_006351 [Variospora aurantia]
MDDDLVHLGVWQDFSEGKDTGWNLTTTTRQATVLTAFIAIGVTAVGTRSWKIFRFLLYQSRRHHLARDAMIREQEVILRNSESDLCTLTNVGCLIWAWRSFGRLLPGDKLRKSKRSSVILLLVSLAHWIFFLFLAASLPSLLSKGQPNPVVLLNSNSCVPYLAEEQEMSRFWSIESTQVSMINFAIRYYDSCYHGDSMVDCNRLEHRRISWNETRGGCPFPENACLAGTEAISFATGHLNLNLFGLNRRDAGDLTLRRRTTCAPINARLFQTEPPGALHDFRYYNFSAGPLEHTSILSGGQLDVKIGRNPYHNDYEVVTVTREGDRTFNGLSVNAAFNRSDADMTAVIIDKENVKYPSPIDDAVFGAHRLVHKLDARARNNEGVEPAAMMPSKWYAADDPVSIIGCADQAEVCYTPSSMCTGLIPLPDEVGWWFDAWKNAGLKFAHWPDGVGKEILDFVHGLVHRAGFKNIVAKRGSDILSIKRYGLGYEMQSDIPPNQWEREARVWFGTSVAKIQVSVMIKAFGSLSKRRRAVYTKGNYTGERSGHGDLRRDLYCHQLRMRSAQHTTISMLGLCCCLGIGSLIWLISSLDGLWMRRLFTYQPHRVLAWELDSAMQLIRQLHEHLQRGIWTTSDLHSVPLAFGTLGVATL